MKIYGRRSMNSNQFLIAMLVLIIFCLIASYNGWWCKSSDEVFMRLMTAESLIKILDKNGITLKVHGDDIGVFGKINPISKTIIH